MPHHILRPLRPGLRTAAAVLALAVAGSACGGGDPAPSPSPSPTVAASPELPPPSPSPTATEEEGVPRPLNGVPTPESEALDRRVVAVKIDNHEDARPQTGLDRADAIYELVVEAGLTRFIALFHSRDAETVGPIRSGRPSDPALVKPLGATFTISGAQPWVIDAIQASGVPLIGDLGPPTTFRSRNRPAPHNLYGDTTELRSLADRRGYPDDPPPTWFTFSPWAAGEGAPADEIALGFSSRTTVTWSWDGEEYGRDHDGRPHGRLTADGDEERITTDTLIVLEAEPYTARPPGSGTAVPAVDTIGTGRALVFADGRVKEGMWSRDAADAPFDLRDADGETLTVPPGRLWISLLPTGRDLTY